MKTSAKIVLAVLATLLVVAALLVFVVAHYTVAFTLDTAAGSSMFSLQSNADDPATGRPSPHREWMLLAATHWSLESQDDLRLNGYYIPAKSPSHRYVVLSHGYRNSAPSMAEYAFVYHNAGWNVLVPDHRAHGYSEGRYIGLGGDEYHDLIGWTELVVAHDSDAAILLHGVSMGAATVMMATGSRELPDNVVAAVEDCGYTSVTDELTDKVSRVMGIPAFPLVPVTSLMTRIEVGYFLGDVDCVGAVSRSVTPTIFIHGEQDEFVPFWMLDEVYSAAACPKLKLVIPSAAHAQSRAAEPELYWSTIGAFVERFMPEGGRLDSGSGPAVTKR